MLGGFVGTLVMTAMMYMARTKWAASYWPSDAALELVLLRRLRANRPGMARLLAMVDDGVVDVVIIAKLDRLTRSVADLAELLKRFERRGVSLVSVADALDTRSATGRLVLNIMVSVSQWEREAIGERMRDAMRHTRHEDNLSSRPPTM